MSRCAEVWKKHSLTPRLLPALQSQGEEAEAQKEGGRWLGDRKVVDRVAEILKGSSRDVAQESGIGQPARHHFVPKVHAGYGGDASGGRDPLVVHFIPVGVRRSGAAAFFDGDVANGRLAKLYTVGVECRTSCVLPNGFAREGDRRRRQMWDRRGH